MKTKNILKLILFIFMVTFAMLANNVVNAAGYDLSATSYDVKVGDKVTINVSFTAAAWEVNVKGKGIEEGAYVGYTEDLSEKTTTKSINLNTSAEGSYTINMTGTITDVNGETTKINKSITVKVSKPVETPPAVEEKPSTNTDTSTEKPEEKPAETKKSSEARLSNLGINPKKYDFSGFKKDKTEYSVEVPNDVTSVEVYATPVDSKAKVSGTGTVTLNEGNNTMGVTVTAEDGITKKTYKLTIKRKTTAEETAEQGEARLSSLGIKPEEYDFKGFTSDQKEYSVEVPNEVDEIEVVAKAIDPKAQITGIGMITLEEGENELKIEVIAQNGTKETYTLTVTRKETEQKEIFGLSNLAITGITLNQKFKNDVYEYNVNITEDISSLDIKALANSENAEVEIIGNENLQEGENTITILVKNTETHEVVTYQITVNKTLAVEEVEEQMSWLKPATWGKEEKIKIAIIIILIVLIICAIIVKSKMRKDYEDESEFDFPGADELDRAISEHQNLTEEENTITEDYEENTIKTAITENYIQDIANDRFESDDDFEPRVRRKGKHF